MHYNLITILGPTAAGKTRLAAELAFKFNGEIISADSRQVYRGMDLGTGKDYQDYIIGNYSVPYHLIDVIEPSDEFNLFMFQKLFHDSFEDIKSRDKLPFLVGGTGLYINSIIRNYDLAEITFDQNEYNGLEKLDIDQLKNMLISIKPDQHNQTDLLDKNRLIRAILIAKQGKKNPEPENRNIIPLIIGVKLDRELVKKRITVRLKERLANGMIEEVKGLVENGITYEKLNFFGLEYKYIGQHLQGLLNFNDMYQKLNSAIHDFAKRQMTWFRKMEKEGTTIYWIEGPSAEQAESIITQYYFDR